LCCHVVVWYPESGNVNHLRAPFDRTCSKSTLSMHLSTKKLYLVFFGGRKSVLYDVIVVCFRQREAFQKFFLIKILVSFPGRDYRLAMEFSDSKIRCGLLTNFSVCVNCFQFRSSEVSFEIQAQHFPHHFRRELSFVNMF